ncbi:MAG: phosphate ABC transporter substrate-binding protein PstS [Candidatus Dormibacteria bacterium]
MAVLGIALAACGSTSGGAKGSAVAAQTSPSASAGPNDLNPPGASLTGAGSSFDNPYFTSAFYEYNKLVPSTTVTYASVGSGGGIAQFQANTVNFGASDVPMATADLAKDTGGPALQIPIALGGEAISYNLYGVKTGLHMTGPVLAQIYMGQITNWDDPALKALNPGVTLPNQAITVVHRSDGSGTTYIFTNYLSVVSPAWAAGPGTGKSVNWPVGVGGAQNAGVAGEVAEVPGSIGYVELAYALQNNFTYCEMQNAAGDYVSPSLATVAADAAQKPDVTSTDFPIVNEPGAQSYPISGYSWVMVYVNQTNLQTGETLAKMLDWLSHAGQQYAKALAYVPLPANIQDLARTTILMMKGPSGQVLLDQ